MFYNLNYKKKNKHLDSEKILFGEKGRNYCNHIIQQGLDEFWLGPITQFSKNWNFFIEKVVKSGNISQNKIVQWGLCHAFINR